MKNMLKKFLALSLCITMLACGLAIPASAAESPHHDDYAMTVIKQLRDFDQVGIMASAGARGNCQIYSISWTTIYTGRKVDRWIHISPEISPNGFELRMFDYKGNVVWQEQFRVGGAETVHRFVGSNVQRVELKALKYQPGGIVYVSDSAH